MKQATVEKSSKEIKIKIKNYQVSDPLNKCSIILKFDLKRIELFRIFLRSFQPYVILILAI